jgi:hypothetical protein
VNESAQLAGGDYRLVFRRAGDRWSHALEVALDGGFQPLVSTWEVADLADWPLSPPLQQLHIEDRGSAGQVALLVGMAGRSHWSVSIELDRPRRRALFDFACRAQQRPAWLGNSYVVARQGENPLPPVRLSGERLQLANWELRFCPIDGAPWQLALASAAPQLSLTVDTSAQAAWPATLRWRFAMEVTPVGS